MSSREGKTSLENADFSSKGRRLNSPTSIEACRLIGVDQEELFSLTLDEYILAHPEAKNLDKSLQEERYNHYEENRKANIEAAKEVGALVAKKALEKNIKTVVYDRGGYVYHGVIKELAEAAREAGLEF